MNEASGFMTAAVAKALTQTTHVHNTSAVITTNNSTYALAATKS